MKITEIVSKYGTPQDTIVTLLEKNRSTLIRPITVRQVLDTKVVDISTSVGEGQYYVEKHKIFDPVHIPDKMVSYKDTNGQNAERLEKVNRIGIGMQKKIVGTAVAFIFGNPVSVTANTSQEIQVQIVEAYKKVLSDNKIDSFNRAVARDLFRSKEVAEIWYTVEAPEHQRYGFPAKKRVKSLMVSNWNGNTFYPFFDVMGDMIAFGRSYDIAENHYFEVYTSDEVVRYKQDNNGWVAEQTTKNEIGRIPVVYAMQESFEWEIVQTAIDRLEFLLSKFADTNDYHSAPKIFVKGKLTGFAKKGESGAILEGEKDSDMKYLSWNHAPESVRTEIENLYKIIYSMSQTPDLSFENLKTLNVGSMSGKLLEFLFLDAHLKVMDKRETFDAYLDRRTSIVVALLGTMKKDFNKAAETLEIKSDIVPFTFNDKVAELEYILKANGEKPVMSHESSVEAANMTADSKREWELIKAEEKSENEVKNPPIPQPITE